MNNANAPAFAASPTYGANGELYRPADVGCSGLSKRELFAGMAMQGWCSNPEVRWNAECRAKAAIESADALLAELEKGKGGSIE